MSCHKKGLWFIVFLIFSVWIPFNTFAEESGKEQAIIAGETIPDFQFNLMNTGETITREQLSGRVYILEFWKTTCPKCQAKMAFLHELFEEFGQKGLSIISLSLDKRVEDIEKFRKDNWPMPWMHVWVEEGWNDMMVKTFRVLRLPTLIVVGPDHRVIGISPEFDDDQIREMIKAALESK